MEIHYINTDLDLAATCDLTPLTDALAERGVCPLNVQQHDNGEWGSILEVANDPNPYEPETTICIMLDAIEAINTEVRKIWAECNLREFNIGFGCGDEPWAFNNGLTASTLRRMTNASTSLRITIYPAIPTRK